MFAQPMAVPAVQVVMGEHEIMPLGMAAAVALATSIVFWLCLSLSPGAVPRCNIAAHTFTQPFS
jgi:hypothetical protein